MTDNHYIYLLTCNEGLHYVGVSKSPRHRIRAHLSGNGSRLVKEAIESGTTFNSEIIFEGDFTTTYNKEIDLIKEYNCIEPNGYNLDSGGRCGGISDRNGSNNTQAILNENLVLEIRFFHKENPLIKDGDIAKIYGVTRENISTLLRGDSWKDVGGPLRKVKTPRKVTEEDILLFKSLKATGLAYDVIGKQLNRSPATIRKYCLL